MSLGERTAGIVAKLRERGHSLTMPRIAVIEEFAGRADHPSAAMLHEALRARHPGIALSTIYDTLSLLVEIGEAAEVAPGDVARRFDPNIGDHCHLVCTECGSVLDLPVDACTEVHAEALRGTGFEVRRHVHEIVGRCANCRKRSS